MKTRSEGISGESKIMKAAWRIGVIESA